MFAGILSSLGTKLAVLAAIAAVLGLLYWHYTSVKAERDAAIAESGALKVAIETQNATINSLETALEEWKTQAENFQKTLNELAKAQVEANQYARKLNDVLSKHNLDVLSIKKPGLIERRINDGTADVLRMFECATGRCADQSSERTETGSPASSP